METGALIQHIREFCLENANDENSVKYNIYFKEAPDNYGLTQPQMNEKAKQLLKEKSVTFNTAINAMPEILKAGKYEEITIVLLLVNGFEKQFTKTLFFEIAEWFSQGINNWAHADTLGMFILPKFFKHKILEDSDFNIWMNSPYKFQRRCHPCNPY
ncbi:MAG: DNA alkylation repair protein [Bacteroidales bacterium]|nr:DNA alkylation repair protein [Bacteroidales bacterium]